MRTPALVIGLLLVCFRGSGEAQCTPPSSRVRLIINDAGTDLDTIWFGHHSSATKGIDPSLCEFELPPFPPAGVFHARFVNPPGYEGAEPPAGLGQGVSDDYRPSARARDTLRTRFQAGTGYPITFTWNISDITAHYDSVRMQDEFGGFVVNVRMHAVGNLVVTNTALSSLLLITFGPVASGPPPAPTLISPANGATNVSLTPTLSWSPAGGAQTYRLQVASDAGFGTMVFDDSTITGTSRQVGPLSQETQYFWRVAARNAEGSSPYSAVWSFTTVGPPPPAPGLISPPNGAQNVSVTPTLTWSSVSGATGYRLMVARDTGFTNVVYDSSIITTSRQIGPLLSNTQYYWRVSASNPGGSGPFSVRFGFTTTAALPAPALIAPADSATIVPQSPLFSWSDVSGATGYHLQVATSTAFTTLLTNDSTITATSAQRGPYPYGARLYWRVRTRTGTVSGEFSAHRVFTVMLQPPGTPGLLTPANNAVNQPVEVVARWSAAFLAAHYTVEVAYDTLMSNIFLRDTTIADTVAVLRVPPSSPCYWRVYARNLEDTYGPPSAIRRFTTGNFPPASPIPLTPSPGDTGVSRTPFMSWVGSPGASSYRLQIALDNLMVQRVYDDSTLTVTGLVAPLLNANTTYFWRVRAKGSAGSSSYSVIRQFTTGTTIVSAGDMPPEMAQEFVLHQNFPNPFNPSTTIPFELSTAAFVTLKVHDLLGREIRTILHQEMPTGSHAVAWNGRDDHDQPVPTGMYFVRMTATSAAVPHGFSATRKAMLLK